jgi:SAM-dependent methyltransferase
MSFEQNYFEKYGSASQCYEQQRDNPTFAKRIRELAALGVTRGRFLDIGCAYGFFIALAEKSGFQGYGIDISRYALQEARRYTRGLLLCLNVSRHPLPFANNCFDVITYMNTLEHLENYHASLREALRTLKPGGLTHIHVPIRGRWFTDDTHVNYFTLDSLRLVLERIGFEIVRMGEERGRWTRIFAGLRLILKGNTNFNYVPAGLGSFIACYARKPTNREGDG